MVRRRRTGRRARDGSRPSCRPRGRVDSKDCLPPELVEQVVLLLRAEAADAAAGGDLQLFHDLAGAGLAHGGEGLEDRRDLHLADDVVVLAREDVSQRHLLRFELCLELRAGTARLGGLGQSVLALLLGQGGQWHRAASLCGLPISGAGKRRDYRHGASRAAKGGLNLYSTVIGTPPRQGVRRWRDPGASNGTPSRQSGHALAAHVPASTRST